MNELINQSFVFFALTQVVRATSVPKTFDYVIVGGGPAGLLIANRLSANPNTTVTVIEAGDSGFYNPNISYMPQSITEYGIFMGTSIDWKYKTAPQKYAGNSTLSYWAGKALGGSTAVNGMTYIRAEKAQIDDWEELGNEGLNWESMLEYYVAQEGFRTPNEELRTQGAVYREDVHGMDGELAVGFSPYLVGGFVDVLKATSAVMG
jgi:choline dehydrogenase-like flavoprotein